MVKLIRLSTDNSNGHFKAQFDSDITIEPNSKIALKNLTFESDFANFLADTNNSRIAFAGDGAIGNSFLEQFVEVGKYTNTNFDNFLLEIENALNRTMSLLDGKENARAHRENFGQFRVAVNNENKIRIEFRQSTVMNINSFAYSDIDYQIKDPFPLGNSEMWNQPVAPFNQFELDDAQEIKLLASAPEVSDERYSYVPRFGLGLSKGCGVFYCRILDSSVTADASQNGFSIGISFGNPRMPDDANLLATGVKDTERNFEIQFFDKNTNYHYRQSHVGEPSLSVQSTLTPNDVDSANIEQHDIIMFKIDNNANGIKCITAHLIDYAGGAGRDRIFFTMVLSDEDLKSTFTPYIYMRGNKNHIELDMVRFTPDPYYLINDQNLIIKTGSQFCDDPIGFNLTNNAYEFGDATQITEPISQPMRQKAAIHYINNTANRLTVIPVILPQLTIAGGLAEVLGFNKLNDTSEFNVSQRLVFRYFQNKNLNNEKLNSQGFTLDAQVESLFFKKDSYIIECLSLPLVCYNSSVDKTNTNVNTNRETRGSRRNILSTIPFSSENGLVQYEPNEIVYIDISNNEKINLRNIELRILDNNFDPIRIVGEADMTLLIDN